MPSFDVVSEVDLQEVKNALDQTKREIGQRYDFKGSKVEVELEETDIKIDADDKMRLESSMGILREKLAKRGVSMKSLDIQEPQSAGGDRIRQIIKVKQGLSEEELKKVSKKIKGEKFKVNTQIQGNQLRVMGKKRDDLQDVIQFLKSSVDDLELQFENFRD